MQGRKPIRFHPQRWVGFFLPYDERITTFIKLLPVAAFDRLSKSWWVPEGSEALLRGEALNLGLLTGPSNEAWLKELVREREAKRNTADAHDYAALGLTPEAPRELVELAYEFWKRELTFAGGAAVKWAEIQSAYDLITGATVV